MFEKFKKGESSQQDAGMMEQEKPGFTAEQVKTPDKKVVGRMPCGMTNPLFGLKTEYSSQKVKNRRKS